MKKLMGFAVLGAFMAAAGGISAQAVTVGVVFDRGGKNDRSFNQSAYEGVQRAEKELGIQLKYVEATDDNAFVPMLRKFATGNYDLIVGIGVGQADAVKTVAAQFPQKHFAIVDAEVNLPNVRSLLFQEHEGSFLMGAIAALKASKSGGKVGFIGGMDIPLIRRFQMGYEHGVKAVNPKMEVLTNYVGVTSGAWNDPPRAKELARAQYKNGAAVIFSAAGASGMGLFDAAEEAKKLAIGVDSNQNYIKPGFILTSMLKRVDVAVFDACQDVKDGKFTGGIKRFGLGNSGIDMAMDQYNKSLITAEELKKLQGFRAAILSGKLQVPDYYHQKK
ncbi:MAG: BMP family protein [Bacteriovoracia bacterium]